MQDLKGKVALITGGSKGIGFGVAQALLDAGMKVAITSRSQSSADEAAKQLIHDDGDSVLALEADVRSYESQEHAVKTLTDKWGGIDLLVANAGLGHFAPIQDMSVEQWNETIETNLNGVFYSIKASLPSLKEKKGYIMTISSLAGTNFFAGGAAYNASKFGLTGFTQSVMLDVRQLGIRVTTIMPGSVATHFNGNEPDDSDSWKIQIEDIGKMVVDLMTMHPRTLPSKIEVRPSMPPQK